MNIRCNRLSVSAILCGLIVSALCSCSADTVAAFFGTGRVCPEVSVDATVVVASENVHKMVVEPMPDVSDFSLSVTDETGGYSHTWTPWTDYDCNEGLRVSTYLVEAFYGDSLSEGFDVPWFHAARRVSLADGAVETVSLECRLANTMFNLSFSERFKAYFTSSAAVLHSAGGEYVRYPSSETRPVYVRPGDVSLLLDLVLADGRKLSFVAADVAQARAGYLYDVNIDLVDGDDSPEARIVVSFDDAISTDDVVIPLSDDFINASSPELVATGFISGETVTLTEGIMPAAPLTVTTSLTGLKSLLLDVRQVPQVVGLPSEIELSGATAEQLRRLGECGLDVTRTESEITVDYTRMLSMMHCSGKNCLATFTLLAVNVWNKVSLPVVLNVDLMPLDLSVVSVAPSIVGINIGEAELEMPVSPDANLSIETLDDAGVWSESSIIETADSGNGRYRVRFALPDGQLPVTARVMYCGEEKARFTVKRVSPRFTISVDAYALKAYVRIHAENPELQGLITSLVSVFAGDEHPAVIARDEMAGEIVVAGLKEDTPYEFRASVFESPTSEDEYTAPFSVRTERCLQLPNPSFEDVKETMKFMNMPSGGRYSQSAVPIFNRQNTVQVQLSTPKGWANTNAKTFCTTSTVANTWYMQPSAYIVSDCHSGGYAVKLQSTAWDNTGAPIADYLQESQPYVYYSRVVPQIKYRAAGKLFLGGYTFDPSVPSETYDEGIGFTSRPSAVNGFYKYLPGTSQPSDRGLVTVELMGEVGGVACVIASGRGELTSSSSYRAFSVPLEYVHSHVRATSIRVMFASTENVGDIAFETSKIATYSNPQTATSLGSALWIDEITLSY